MVPFAEQQHHHREPGDRHVPAAATPPSYTGLSALLTPENSALLLIDHQGAQFANLHSHEPQLVVNNVVALAKTAKLLGCPRS
jgi:hypothetical protein